MTKRSDGTYRVRCLHAGMRLAHDLTPQVGDEIVPGPGQANQVLEQRYWLAVRIGPAPDGGELWLAWISNTGQLASVNVGDRWWVLRH